MDASLDDKLCRDFPLLYADRHGDPKYTALIWGFEVNDGWYPLIRRLSEKLEGLIEKIDLEFDDECPLPTACQVKEKYGTLRFYMTCATEEMERLIEEAEFESETVCENCGAEGALRRGSWLRTQCDRCHEEQQRLDTPAGAK